MAQAAGTRSAPVRDSRPQRIASAPHRQESNDCGMEGIGVTRIG
jgi:hypothetical protein